MVATVVGTRSAQEQLTALEPEMFRHFIKDRGLMPSNILKTVIAKQDEMLEDMLPDLTFEEAYQRSGLLINVSVAPTDPHQPSRLLNAIASPHVCVREAVLASTAFPGLMPSVTLMAKSVDGEHRPYLSERRWWDGSISDELPAKRLARLFGVNHYVVSQTSPHVLPFITDPKQDTRSISILRRTGQRTLRELFNGTAALVVPALRFSPRLTQASTMMLSVINQDYLGDINLLPPRRLPNPLRYLDFRTDREARELIRMGERATWPRMEMIRTQTKISRTLDRILGQRGALDTRRAPIEALRSRTA